MKELSEPKFIFVGNHRCLDFINTEIVQKGCPVDLLRDFSDLVEWLAKAQILSSTEAKEALKRWDKKPQGERTLERAWAFRAILREMIEKIVRGRSLQQHTIDEINNLLRNRTGYIQLVRIRGTFKTQFHVESDELNQLVVPIAESASDLLCHGDLSLMKKCENPDCVLYFYDISKNHTRRWCSMSICGNRTKVAAHYRRHRRTKEK